MFRIFEVMAGSTPLSQLRRVSIAGDTFTPSLPKKVLGAALGAIVAGLVLTAGQAKALVVPVTVGGVNYDVTTFTGAYTDGSFTSKFTTTDMPWWGDDTLAESFASAVGLSSGLDGNYDRFHGPFFAFQLNAVPQVAVRVQWGSITPRFGVSPSQIATYATATLAPASVPGPLPILGVAAAFGFSRKLRKRIKLHKGSSDISNSAGA